jgi:hypothetical protein
LPKLPVPASLAGALSLALALAAGADTRSPEEIAACVAANLPARSSVQTVSFQARDRTGALVESRARVYWQRSEDGLSRAMVRFSAPNDLRGAGLLFVQKASGQNDMLMYLPELGKVRRVTGRMVSGSAFGTDFSYEELERVLGIARQTATQRLPDARLDGRAVYALETRPGPGDGSAFERVVTLIAQENCVPLRMEFYEPPDRLRKELSTDPDSISKEGELYVPRRWLMRDLRDETQTVLAVEEIEVGAEIPRKMFSTRELEAGAR